MEDARRGLLLERELSDPYEPRLSRSRSEGAWTEPATEDEDVRLPPTMSDDTEALGESLAEADEPPDGAASCDGLLAAEIERLRIGRGPGT
jgi:hypothetical protein